MYKMYEMELAGRTLRVDVDRVGYQGRKPRKQAQARHHHRRNGSGRCIRSRFAQRTGI